MNPLVSIVIPTFDRAHVLGRALESVLNQTWPHWEALVVDNHSSDNTDNLVKGFNDPRIKLFKIHNNGVIAASRNLGVSLSQGEFIAFLDSDDWWMPEKLEESLSYLRQGADVVYHPLFLVVKTSQKLFWRKVLSYSIKSPIYKSLLNNGNQLPNSSVVLRKQILKEIGGISELKDLVGIEDFDAWMRISKITEKFKMVPKTLGFYWAGGGNVSNPARTLVNLEAFRGRYLDEFEDESGNVLWWFYYAKGRAHYQLGNFSMAKNMLARIGFWQVPFMVALKSLWMSLSVLLFCREESSLVKK